MARDDDREMEGRMTERVTIDVNLDAKCKRCGKGGATPSGFCIACVTKNMTEGKYDRLLDQVRRQARCDEIPDYELDYCPKCIQTTNHLDGECQKCGETE